MLKFVWIIPNYFLLLKMLINVGNFQSAALGHEYSCIDDMLSYNNVYTDIVYKPPFYYNSS